MRRAALTLLAAMAILSLGASAAQANQPWWGIEVGARPTNLWAAPDSGEIQEVRTEWGTSSFSPGNQFFAATVEVGGEIVGCLGGGELVLFNGLLHLPADALCEEQPGGFPATETAAEFAALLEAASPAYAPGVEVQGPATAGEGAFTVTTPGRWPAAPADSIKVSAGVHEIPPEEVGEEPTVIKLGKASAQIVSQDSGRLALTVTDIGDAPASGAADPIVFEDELPAGVTAYRAEAFAGYNDEDGPVECSILAEGSVVACTMEGELPAFEAIEVEIHVVLDPAAVSGAGTVRVSGGLAPPKEAVQTLHVSPEATRFGIQSFAMGAEEEGGGEARQAGSHPFQLTTALQLNSGPVLPGAQGHKGQVVDQALPPRNFRFPLPLGLVGDPTPIPTCSFATFTAMREFINECPAASAIGVASVTVIEGGVLGFARIAVPIFNLPPAHGEPARFGFMAAGVPVTIDTALDPEDEYRITAFSANAPELATVLATTATFWGNPGDPAHDGQRGWGCVYFKHPGGCEEGSERPEEVSQAAFLRLPVSCSEPLDFGFELEPWNTAPGALIERATSPGPYPLGCSNVPFDPSISAAPTSRLAESPSGLDFNLELPNSGLHNPEGIAEAEPAKLEVALPEGITANPSAAAGLAVCTEAQFHAEQLGTQPGEGCPQASKLGSVTGHSPLVAGAIEGSLYLAKPYENPEGTLLALYIAARLPERGVLVKQAGRVVPDPRTGQLISTFEGLPQLPYSDFKLHFREGGRAPLVTPPGCGDFTTVARFTPWSAQNPDAPAPGEIVERTAPFVIERGVDGGACPSGPAPFRPGFEAGTLNNQAGSYSPFVMRLTRKDGEQDMGRFSFVLPPGVVPKLAGIPYCPEAGIARAQSRQGPHGGTEERSDPSCPAASQIGRTLAGAGVGNQLTYVPGKLYLGGPYHGDPISAVSITPAVAGPFDAGTVVVREALRLNPVTHVGEVDGAASDPIPHILKGIPLNLRDLRVYADRPEFTLNATSCEPFAASSTIWGDGTALEPLGETPVTLSSRYQAAGCASLGFKPKLAIKLKGGTKRGSHPALKAVATPRPGDANFAGAVVTLPHSAFLDQAHIRTICTRVQFAAGAGNGAQCPAGAVYGHAKAWSPLLDQPLEGPVFLRSSSHNLPDLVLALHGLVDIDLAARIDSVHGGIRSTFEDIPDAPVSRFVLEMQGGKKGLIVNSTNLCASTNRAKAKLSGQNGKLDEFSPAVRAAGCGKAKKGKKHGARVRHERNKGKKHHHRSKRGTVHP